MPNAENSVNEKESVDAIHAYLNGNGTKVTKTLIDEVLDAQKKLMTQALVAGKSVKIQGLFTIAPTQFKATNWKLPNGTTGTTPAHTRVTVIESDKFIDALNADNDGIVIQ